MSGDPLGRAVEQVREGGLLAYPTETVWGLGADAISDRAVARLRAWKGRGEDAPLSILVGSAGELEALGIQVGAASGRLAERFWPGPLTLVLPAQPRFARGVAREDGAVGVRCSSHPVAAALASRLRSAGAGPLTATSLNRSGEPAARTRKEARALCGSQLSEPQLIGVEDAEAEGAAESTVVDATGPELRVLRWGALAPHDLDPLLREDARA